MLDRHQLIDLALDELGQEHGGADAADRAVQRLLDDRERRPAASSQAPARPVAAPFPPQWVVSQHTAGAGM